MYDSPRRPPKLMKCFARLPASVSVQPTGNIALIDRLGSRQTSVYPALRSEDGQVFISGLVDRRRNDVARGLDDFSGRISVTFNNIDKLTTQLLDFRREIRPFSIVKITHRWSPFTHAPF